MTKEYRYPNILQSIWILILLEILQWVLGRLRDIFVGMILPWVLFRLRGIFGIGILRWHVPVILLLHHPAVNSLIRVIPYGLILVRGLKRDNSSIREICPLAPVRLSLLFLMALTAIGTLMLEPTINSLLGAFRPRPEWYNEYVSGRTQLSFWNSVDLVIIAPLTEELLVRGLILRGFLSRYSARTAILASAIFFGLIHHFPWNFVGPTVLGILLAWWFIETRSMLPCFLGHALCNALIIAYNWLLLSEIEFGYHFFWWNLVAVILTVLGVWLLIRQFRKSSDTVAEDVSGDKPDEL